MKDKSKTDGSKFYMIQFVNIMQDAYSKKSC